jgi:uracil-DNA glycosylase
MVLDDVLKLLEEKVFSASVKSDSLFNQYNDKNLEIDLPNADEIRQENLGHYLRSFQKRPSVIVIGEAPGWRGCRFSGVPFTSEFQLYDSKLPFTGNQSSNSYPPYKENTATIFWKYMRNYHSKFFAWNCIPFHPHESDNVLTNRTPSKEEIGAYLTLLSEIVSLMKPSQIVAIGKSAESTLEKINISFTYVRHPSHGGANEFRAGMEKVFG